MVERRHGSRFIRRSRLEAIENIEAVEKVGGILFHLRPSVETHARAGLLGLVSRELFEEVSLSSTR